MKFLQKRIEYLFASAKIGINNAKDDLHISEVLATRGYDEVRLDEGYAIYEVALNLVLEKRKKYRSQTLATKQLQSKIETARIAYWKNMKYVKLLLTKDPEITRLKTFRKGSLEGWIIDVKDFYKTQTENVNLIAALARYFITTESLAADLALLDEIEGDECFQEAAKEAAQTSTIERDKALSNLNEWICEFHEVCKIEFLAEKNILEKLNINVYGDSYRRPKSTDKSSKNSEEKIEDIDYGFDFLDDLY